MATIYWAVYPSDIPDPTASALINATVRRGIHGNDTAPTGSGAFSGTAITGLGSIEYRLAAVWLDATEGASNVVVSDSFRVAGTLHWSIYPSEQSDPDVEDVVTGTVANGVHGSDTSPVFGGEFEGTELTPIEAGTEYKLAAVWDDGTDTSNLVISEAFTASASSGVAPVFFEGSLPVADAGTIDRWHQGIPLDADSRVCVSIDGMVDYFHNGVPFDSDGRVVVSADEVRLFNQTYEYVDAGDVNGYFQGLPVS